MKNSAGVDGCPYGWVSAFANGKEIELKLFKKFQDLVSEYPSETEFWVDMPIGLSGSKYRRTLDQKIRSLLPKGKKSSVFTPACREAIYTNDYTSAREINQRVTGKSISIQSWNISTKIRELDQLLIQTPKYKMRINESHPELCFLKLNNGDSLPSKHAPQGKNKRIEILSQKNIDVSALLKRLRLSYSKSKVKDDDILDALVLLVAQRGHVNTLYDGLDEKNIEIKLKY